MKAKLVRNTGSDSENAPYFVELDIVNATIDAGSTFTVPVEIQHGRTGKTYSIEMCGFAREAANPNDLPAKVWKLALSLIHIARFPSYVFIARRAGEIYPVYTIENEVYATTPGGPIFRHVELAKVREYLTDYLHDIGILGEEGASDKLHVRGINPHTLGFRRPVYYLKKRVVGQVDFWAPVFESGDGKKNYTYAASARREVNISDGKEVLELREVVAKALKADNRLVNQFDLRPDRLMPAYWKRLKATLEAQGVVEIGSQHLELYKLGAMWLMVEPRDDEDRYGLYIGSSADDVTRRVKADFTRRDIDITEPLVMAG